MVGGSPNLIFFLLPMKYIRYFLILLLSSYTMTCVYAQSASIRIANVQWSEDKDSVEITLSEKHPRTEIIYGLYMNGMVQRGGAITVLDSTTETVSGFQKLLKDSTDGRATLELIPCPKNSVDDEDDDDLPCGEAYNFSMDIGPSDDWFIDVPAGHPYETAIRYVKQERIVSGHPGNRFAPDDRMNRAGFAKIIALALTDQETVNKCTNQYFPDIQKNIWFERFVCFAYEHSLVSGYPDGNYRPAEMINFAEAAKILANAYNILEGGSGDNTSGEPWYERYVRALASRNAIPTSIERFDSKITRGEMVEIIYRLRTGNTTLSSLTYEGLTEHGSASKAAQTFVHETDGYEIRIPHDWTVEEDVDLESYAFSYPRSMTGSDFHPKDSSNPRVILFVSNSCSDADRYVKKSASLTVIEQSDFFPDNKIFSSAHLANNDSFRWHGLFQRTPGSCYVLLVKGLLLSKESEERMEEPQRTHMRNYFDYMDRQIQEVLQSIQFYERN